MMRTLLLTAILLVACGKEYQAPNQPEVPKLGPTCYCSNTGGVILVGDDYSEGTRQSYPLCSKVNRDEECIPYRTP